MTVKPARPPAAKPAPQGAKPARPAPAPPPPPGIRPAIPPVPKPAGLFARARAAMAHPVVHWLGLLGLCAAYLQGGFDKATDFPAALAEMAHFGLQPAAPLAVATIILELGASALVLAGFYRWLGALALAGFTLAATLLANRFWEMAPPERFMAANGFFEHVGLIGGLLLVAWEDLRRPSAPISRTRGRARGGG